MGWQRSQNKRTENGPRFENPDPGHGCNSTHVARARKWWAKFANRTARRTGKTSPKYRGYRRP